MNKHRVLFKFQLSPTNKKLIQDKFQQRFSPIALNLHTIHNQQSFVQNQIDNFKLNSLFNLNTKLNWTYWTLIVMNIFTIKTTH